MKTNIGFNNRQFLTKKEWLTYLKRMPVRYIRKKKTEFCEICLKPPLDKNPLENSHIIAFRKGIVDFALTPDFLDENTNILSAHKIKCNKSAELSTSEICRKLIKMNIHKLPNFLPEETLKVWNSLFSNKIVD